MDSNTESTPFIGYYVLGLLLLLFAGILIYNFVFAPPAKSGPKTAVVSEAQLLHFRGVDLKKGNLLIGAKSFMVNSSHTSGLLIWGSGTITSHDRSTVILMLSFKLNNGDIETLSVPMEEVPKTIQPGPPRIRWILPHPFKRAYRRLVGKPISQPYYGGGGHDGTSGTGDDHGFHDMTPLQLIQQFVGGIRLRLDQKTFNQVFGGVG